MSREHSDSHYEAELRKLRADIAAMGGDVVRMLRDSMRARRERDSALAQRVIDSDQAINLREVEVDDHCVGLIARRQPLASDLRLITTGLKIVTDLERVGDLCVNICERVIELNASDAVSIPADLERMATEAEAMVEGAVAAFVSADAASARRIIARDRVVDALHAQVFSGMLERMSHDLSAVNQATRVQAIAKHLERIADHATNVAEMVVFMVEGRDIRHLRAQMPAGAPRGVLFLCIHNAARSQMAEGLARTLLPAGVHVWSAGSLPASAVRDEAVRVMNEAGIDISAQRPKRISDIPLSEVDTVVTLCSEEVCVALPGETRRETWVFPDPSSAKDGAASLSAFRDVRDGLRQRLEEFAVREFGSLSGSR